MREPVAAADDERLEGVLGVQPGRDRARRLVALVHRLRLRLARSLRLVLVDVARLGLARRWRLLRLVGVSLRGAVGLVPGVLVGVRIGVLLRLRLVRGQLGLLRRSAQEVILGGSREAVHHRQRRAQRPRRLVRRGDRARVDGDGDLDRTAELLGEGVDDQRPQLGLQVLLDERIGRGDQRRVLDEAERPGQPEPGELAWRQAHLRESVEGARPNVRQIQITHRALPSPRHLPELRRVRPVRRNSLSTGSSTRCERALRAVSPSRGGS